MIAIIIVALLLLLGVFLLFGATVLALTVAAFILISLLRFGVVLEYDQDGFKVKAKVGPLSVKIYPAKEETETEKQKKAVKKALKAERKKEKKKPDEQKPGGIKGLLDKLPPIKTALARIKRKLLIKRLIIHYTAASSDPSSTAMAYGAANTAVGLILPPLESSLKIRKRDVRVFVDFESEHHSVYAYASVSLAIWEAVYIASALMRLLSINKTAGVRTPQRKEVKENG